MAVRKTPENADYALDMEALKLNLGNYVDVKLRTEFRQMKKTENGFGNPEVFFDEIPIIFKCVYGLSDGRRATPLYISGNQGYEKFLLGNSINVEMNGDGSTPLRNCVTKLVSLSKTLTRGNIEIEIDIEDWFSLVPTPENLREFNGRIKSDHPVYPFIETRLLQGMPDYAPEGKNNVQQSVITDRKFIKYAMKYLDKIV